MSQPLQQPQNERIQFPIPTSLPDLERDPYNLLPYPPNAGFEQEDNEATRANSFDALIDGLVDGNDVLQNDRMMLFERIVDSNTMEDDDESHWCNRERMQALYTLVR